jgi:hypothetical protein
MDKSPKRLELESEYQLISTTANRQQSFIKWLYNYCMGSLYPGASVQQRLFATKILSFLQQPEKINDSSDFRTILSQTCLGIFSTKKIEYHP